MAVKKEKKEIRMLTDEELEKVDGGITEGCVPPHSGGSTPDDNGMAKLQYQPVQGTVDVGHVFLHSDGSPLNADEMSALLKYQTADGLLNSSSVLTDELSNISEADMADPEVRFMTMQNVYNMSLSMGQSIMQTTMAEYISEPSSPGKE